ncbi:MULTISPECIES: N-acetylmuramoyl-L-alanine amidase [Prauserella salsuginis group]|uniref:N-acetylmuramoyl-L-alanine amidase n=1 Tax=Prauserella salsuginis TaxID=387889 RepID=A0ABW6G5S9_9PSEU|nr:MULTISPECIES: peptidoglycan recognition family protein [Prauserella salsuginis group]MCR3719125.1 N-acetylmuramoyl-L-alanine amidase [Prauserella flava]MCR3735862.1 N-acetylmuramoyl-L-alanine amidase [Prauserella salsuginis]
MAKPPSPPYVPAKHTGGKQTRLDRIVLHSTVSDTKRGGARAIARYFQNPTYVSSAHYVVDPGEVIQTVWDHTIAWHDGTNVNSIGVEMCDRPRRVPGRWQGRQHKQMLDRTADLVRQLCLAYDIPMRKLTPAQIRAGEKGICGHADMRDAFPGSTSHWDPGHFPWRRFIRLVNRNGATTMSKGNALRAIREYWNSEWHKIKTVNGQVSLRDSILRTRELAWESWQNLGGRMREQSAQLDRIEKKLDQLNTKRAGDE